MKRLIIFLCLSFLVCVSVGFAGEHKAADYSGHFGDIDANNDEAVTWDEFKSHFEHAQKGMFEEADTDKNAKIDHDEWHAFKEKHNHGHEKKHGCKE